MKTTFTPAEVEDLASDAESAAVLCEMATSGLDIYAPDERERRELDARREFDDDVAASEERVEAVARAARAELDLIEDIDPRGIDDLLTEADIAVVVSTWLPIAERDVANMPPTSLETRCRTLLAIGDVRRIAAYAIAIRSRVDSLSKQFSSVDVPAPVTNERELLSRLGEPLEAALVDPNRGKRKKAAEAQLDLANGLRKRLGDARAKAHRTHERDMAIARARYGTL